jgi:CHAD domain-containing protein
LDKALRQQDKRAAEKKRARFRELADRAAALAFEVEGELRDWPALKRINLHPFRLKVKKLRYVLQMADDSDSRFVQALAEVKDDIGEWHDWQELSAVAKKVVQHPMQIAATD